MIFFVGLFGTVMLEGMGFALWPIIKKHPILTVVSIISAIVMIRFLPGIIGDMQANLRDQLSHISVATAG